MPIASIRRSEELVAITQRFYEALVAGDGEMVTSFFSDDDCFLCIGADAEEWWSGSDVAAVMIRRQFEEADGVSFASDIRPGRLEAYEEGTVGWVQDAPTIVMPSGAEHVGRFTFVLRKEGMYWRMVQGHLSFGLPNADVFEKTYTTSIQAIVDSVEMERPNLSDLAAGDGTVTIVFTDIEGSTESAERLGDRRFVEMLRWHDDVVRTAAATHSGTVVKSQGDGYMLVFASASNALDFAIALAEATSQGYDGRPVRIRVGLNSGDVVRERDDFFGHAVTVAARVAGQALGGEVLSTDLVAALVVGAGRFSFGPSRVAELKGIADPVNLRPLFDSIELNRRDLAPPVDSTGDDSRGRNSQCTSEGRARSSRSGLTIWR